MKRLVITAIVLFVLAISGQSAGSTTDPTGLQSLVKQDGSFELTMIHPQADFSLYSRLYPSAIVLKFRDNFDRAANSATGSLIAKKKKQKGPGPETIAHFEEVIRSGIVDQLTEDAGFALADQTGPSTLILRVAIVDIVSNIPPKPKRRFRGDIIAEGTIVFDLIDAESGEIQARLGERRQALRGADSGSVRAADLWPMVENWAGAAAADLLGELHRIQADDSQS